MYASWLRVFRPHGYGVIRMDAGSLDVLAHDLPPHHVLGDEMQYALRIHPIIQSSHAARAGQRGKPGPERRRYIAGENLSHEHIGALRAAPEATLPQELGVLLRTVRRERGTKHLVEAGRAVSFAALGAAADHDLEAARHGSLSLTGTRRHVNPRSPARRPESAFREQR